MAQYACSPGYTYINGVCQPVGTPAYGNPVSGTVSGEQSGAAQGYATGGPVGAVVGGALGAAGGDGDAEVGALAQLASHGLEHDDLFGGFQPVCDDLEPEVAGEFDGKRFVDVGDVAHICDVRLAVDVAQQPEQHVEHDHRTEIADVGEVVDGGTAHIHRHPPGIARGEGPLGAGQGVVEMKAVHRARVALGVRRPI